MKKRFLAFVSLVLVMCLLSGCCLIHSWDDATCIDPKTCSKCGETEGEPLGHEWDIDEATCTRDQVCTECGEIGEKAPGHRWDIPSATCTEDQHCTVCGEMGATATGHYWTEETDTTPQMCRLCNLMVPMDMPANGTVFIGKGKYCGAELTIHCSSDKSYYIKLKDSSGNDVYSFFVQAGKSVYAPVPTGYFYVYFACGTAWYGPEYLFGPDTSYSKDSALTDFVNYNWTYTLKPSTGGNFSESPVDEDEF